MSIGKRAMRSRSERGLSESLQWTLLAPVFALCLLALIEGVLWLNARTVVTEAAFAAAEAQAAYGTRGEVAAPVASRVAQAGGLRNPQVAVSNDSTWVRVSVSAQSVGFVGWFPTTVTATATRPKERT
jgi:Flp pilus assembly protein TadG